MVWGGVGCRGTGVRDWRVRFCWSKGGRRGRGGEGRSLGSKDEIRG